jgi:hypothetical protein
MFTGSQVSADSDVSDASDDEQQRVIVQVDHVDPFVPPSPPVLQQQSQSIAADHPRRNIASHKRLIEEYNIVHYAMSCAE